MVVLLSKPVKTVLSAQPGTIMNAYVCVYSSIQPKVPPPVQNQHPCMCLFIITKTSPSQR